MADRTVLKLARQEYLERARLLAEAGEEPLDEAIAIDGQTSRRTSVGTQRTARRKVSRLLKRKENPPVDLLKRAYPSGTSRNPEVQKALELTGIAESKKV